MGKMNPGATQAKNDLKNCFLGELLNPSDGDGKHDDAEEFMIMSESDRVDEDEEMAPPSSDEDDISFGSETSKRVRKKPIKNQKTP
jgi:hypothetical protein